MDSVFTVCSLDPTLHLREKMELCLSVWSHNGPLNGWYDDDNFSLQT